MFVQIRSKSLFNAIVKCGKRKKYNISTVSEIKNDVKDTVEAVYPAIEDLGFEKKVLKRKQQWHDKIKSLKTVEEKLFELNMPRYYGWKLILLKEHNIPYDSLSHAQYITRTHIMREPGLPTYYNDVTSAEQLDSVLPAIKDSVEDSLLFEYCNTRREEISDDCPKNLDNIRSKSLIQKINRVILIHLSLKYPHLLHAGVDFEPRLEASWFTGGINPSAFVKRAKRSIKFMKKYADDPIDLPFQYLGQPVMHLRHKYPLKEIISLNKCEDPALDVPIYQLFPKVLGHKHGRRHITNIPGFWPGDQNEFGLLSYHNCPYLKGRPESFNDTSSAFTVQAILASYSWLLSQACYQGFSTFNEITYPLITQTVITNGQWWSFFVYQLNTTLLHSEHAIHNPRRNICWITEPIKLFDEIENGKIHGLNEEVLKTLIKFYMNAPEERIGVNMKPYLGDSEKLIADIEHDERRNWLEQRYKHLVSIRSRHRRIPEIPDWQRIYLRDHKTRPMDKKREPWEFGINPFRRRLDDHLPPYIPRCLRENPKKRKVGRWEKTYYP